MKSRKKGFTLVELIIVVAIIGILSAVLIPSWMSYIRQSRLKTQNANAKVIFNATQTIMLDYSFRERSVQEETFNTDADKFVSSYYMDNVGDGDFYLTWNPTTKTAAAYDAIGGNAKNSVLANAIAERINRVFANSESTFYTVYVNNYQVQSVASGRTNGDRYKGTYPQLAKESDMNHTVLAYPMKTVTLNPEAPTEATT